MLRYRVGKPSQVRLWDESGTFKRVSDLVREQGAVCGINAGFYSGRRQAHPKGSVPCGRLVRDGATIRPAIDFSPAGPTDGHYHAIYKVCGKVRIAREIPENTPGNVVEWGLTMGPRLLAAGQVCHESIDDPRWTGIKKDTGCPRAAVGILPNDDVVLAYDSSATLVGLAESLRKLGCVDAIACDGGPSASYNDLETGVSAGYALMPNALLMMPVQETETEVVPVTRQGREAE